MKWRSADLSVRVAVPMVVAFVLGLALLNAYIWGATSAQTVESSVDQRTRNSRSVQDPPRVLHRAGRQQGQGRQRDEGVLLPRCA